MKAGLFLWFFVLASLQSCQKETSDFTDLYWGEASALRNGQPWRGLIYARPHSPYGFYIRMDVYNAQGFQREALTIFKIPATVQHNQIDTIRADADTTLTGATYSTQVDDGDVLGDLFKVYHHGGNYVNVSSFNKATGEVSGEFAVTLVFAGPPDTRSDPAITDTVHFTGGQFRAKVMAGP